MAGALGHNAMLASVEMLGTFAWLCWVVSARGCSRSCPAVQSYLLPLQSAKISSYAAGLLNSLVSCKQPQTAFQTFL